MNYYVIETNYVGPNQDQHIDADTIEIRSEPATGNASGDIIFEGWCGTTNDWSVHAHGVFETVEEARAWIQEECGPVRDRNQGGESFLPDHAAEEGIIEVYKPGQFEPMNKESTGNWAWDGIQIDVTADTTDEQIQALIEEYESAANADGGTLDKATIEAMAEERRSELQAEAE